MAMLENYIDQKHTFINSIVNMVQKNVMEI